MQYKYLIIGAGMTAAAAVDGIRKIDSDGAIGLIGIEPDPPYDRPPLTKGLWKGKSIESVWRDAAKAGVTFHLGRQVNSIDPKGKQVIDDKGTRYGYEKLLLATGGTPRKFPFGGNDIIYYRTLGDYKRLRSLADRGRRFAVVGGGFIGSEIAAALAMNKKEVTLIFPGDTIGDRIFPQDLGIFINSFYKEKGVTVSAGNTVIDVERQGGQFRLQTQNKKDPGRQELLVDGVVAGIGIQPNLDLARSAGIAVNNGIIVDEFLRTDQPDIYAAGDVAEFYNPSLGKRLRVEHEDNANTMGALAGQNMAGGRERYDHLPFFYSDLFDLGYEAVGDLDPRLETVADWSDRYRQGVIYYLRNGRVAGVLLWNVWEQVEAARRLIAETGPFRPEDLKGRLPAKS